MSVAPGCKGRSEKFHRALFEAFRASRNQWLTMDSGVPTRVFQRLLSGKAVRASAPRPVYPLAQACRNSTANRLERTRAVRRLGDRGREPVRGARSRVLSVPGFARRTAGAPASLRKRFFDQTIHPYLRAWLANIAGDCLLVAAADRRLMTAGAARIGIPELQIGAPFPPIARCRNRTLKARPRAAPDGLYRIRAG